MAANPGIVALAAAKTAVDTFVQILIENTGPAGMVSGQIRDTSCQTQIASQTVCVPITTNPYITQLYWWMPIQAFSVLNNICVQTYICASGDDCINGSCASWSTSPYNTRSNVVVGTALGVVPNAVSGLSVTPGDKSLTVSWIEPNNAFIFGYAIALKDNGGNILAGGTITFNRTSIPITNLTNGVPYTVEVRPRSDDGWGGPTSSITGTPTAPPCIAPLCTIQVQS